MPSNTSERAEPDTFIALIPVPWNTEATQLLHETHGETWVENVHFEIDHMSSERAESGLVGRAIFEDGVEAQFFVDEPIEELAQLAGQSREPFSPTELLLLQQHQTIWRLQMPGGRDNGRDQAQRFARLLSSFVEAGAAGVFLPATLQLHSPRYIKHQTMDLSLIPSLINLFVSAWHSEDFMCTRGLTFFGLPELETSTAQGLNAAFFRLLDVASGMIAQQDVYPIGARLELGPAVLHVEQGPQGSRDSQVPICGSFGVLTLRPEL